MVAAGSQRSQIQDSITVPDKSVQLKDIVEIWKREQNDEGAEK